MTQWNHYSSTEVKGKGLFSEATEDRVGFAGDFQVVALILVSLEVPIHEAVEFLIEAEVERNLLGEGHHHVVRTVIVVVPEIPTELIDQLIIDAIGKPPSRIPDDVGQEERFVLIEAQIDLGVHDGSPC